MQPELAQRRSLSSSEFTLLVLTSNGPHPGSTLCYQAICESAAAAAAAMAQCQQHLSQVLRRVFRGAFGHPPPLPRRPPPFVAAVRRPLVPIDTDNWTGEWRYTCCLGNAQL